MHLETGYILGEILMCSLFILSLFNHYKPFVMKATKAMIAFILVTVLTWLFFGMIGYIASDISYKECLRDEGLIVSMFMLGWIPGVVVMYDIMESKKNKPTIF